MSGYRGGRRKGTPGVGYTNRTDLGMDYAPSTAEHTPASGGVEAAPPTPGPAQVYPEDIPKLDDPGDHSQPWTTGLPTGAGTPPSPFTQTPGDPNINIIRAAYDRNPTPQLARVLRMMESRYGNL